MMSLRFSQRSLETQVTSGVPITMTPRQQRFFEWCIASRDILMHSLDRIGQAFRAGYFQPEARPKSCFWEIDSLADAAWRAGRHCYHADQYREASNEQWLA